MKKASLLALSLFLIFTQPSISAEKKLYGEIIARHEKLIGVLIRDIEEPVYEWHETAEGMRVFSDFFGIPLWLSKRYARPLGGQMDLRNEGEYRQAQILDDAYPVELGYQAYKF